MEITQINTSLHFNNASNATKQNERYTEFKSEGSGESWSRVAIIVASLIAVGSLSFCIFRVIGLYKMGILGELSRNWSTLVSAGTSIVGTNLLVFLCICQKSKTVKHEYDATLVADTPPRSPTQSLAEGESSVRSLTENDATSVTNTPTSQSRPTIKKEESFDWEHYFSEDHFKEQNLNEIGYDAFQRPGTYLIKHFEDHEMCVVLKTLDNWLLCSRRINEETFSKIKDQLLKLNYKEEKFEADDNQHYALLSTDFNSPAITTESFPTLPINCFMKLIRTGAHETQYYLALRTSNGVLLRTPFTNEDQKNRWEQRLLSRGYTYHDGLFLTVIKGKEILKSKILQRIPKGFFHLSLMEHAIFLRSRNNVFWRISVPELFRKETEYLRSLGYHNGGFMEYQIYDLVDQQRYKDLPRGEYVAMRASRLENLAINPALNFFVLKTDEGELFRTYRIQDSEKYSYEQTLALTYQKSTMKF